MTESTNEDRAVIARIGGRMYRSGRYDQWGDMTYRAAAEIVASQRLGTAATLPEAAFDWPIYRAALAAPLEALPQPTLGLAGGINRQAAIDVVRNG